MSVRRLKRKKKRRNKADDSSTAQMYFDIATQHKGQGNIEKAIAFYKKALKADPDHIETLNNLGNTLHHAKHLPEALAYYKKACQLSQHLPQLHYNYGTALYEAGSIHEAIQELLVAIKLSPEYAEAFASLGVACHASGELEKAKAALEQAIRLNPDYLKAHRFLGLVLKDQGDIDGAKKQFTRTVGKWPEDAFSWYLLSQYRQYTSEETAEIPAILSLLKKREITSDDAIFLHFTLGKIYDDLGQFDKAFHHYSLGNRTKRATFGTATISTGIDLNRIRAVFTPDIFDRFSSQGSDSEVPVFIVGMPRSGTTLVEQICASHSAVHGAGELKIIREVIDSFTPQGGTEKSKKGKTHYPECLKTIHPAGITGLAEQYVRKLRGDLTKNIIRVTNKMPTNFIELGVIRILFPKARIIHCIRNPMDTCLSNYFQNFDEGNECSFDLRELALYYRKYKALMAFWKDVLPGGIFEVRYESLVDNFDKEAQRLIDFLGLEWEEQCLTFFQTKRMVQTSSDFQVRQPIYNKSVGRHENYAEFLEPLRKGLESTTKLV